MVYSMDHGYEEPCVPDFPLKVCLYVSRVRKMSAQLCKSVSDELYFTDAIEKAASAGGEFLKRLEAAVFRQSVKTHGLLLW